MQREARRTLEAVEGAEDLPPGAAFLASWVISELSLMARQNHDWEVGLG